MNVCYENVAGGVKVISVLCCTSFDAFMEALLAGVVLEDVLRLPLLLGHL
jgi:hypothetical protein